MSFSEPIVNLIRREIGRFMAQQSRPRVGRLTSWNPDTHSAKLLLLPGTPEHPDGIPTGWIPVTTDAIGDGYGDALAPAVGDQMEVSFQGGDPEVPRITGRHYSNKQKPPRLEEGEFVRRHKSGSELRQDKDGNITLSQGGAKVRIAKSGAITIESANGITLKGPVTVVGDIGQQGSIHSTGVHQAAGGHI